MPDARAGNVTRTRKQSKKSFGWRFNFKQPSKPKASNGGSRSEAELLFQNVINIFSERKQSSSGVPLYKEARKAIR